MDLPNITLFRNIFPLKLIYITSFFFASLKEVLPAPSHGKDAGKGFFFAVINSVNTFSDHNATAKAFG